MSTRTSRTPSAIRRRLPPSWERAFFAAAALSASMRSMTASASVRSSFPFRKAWRVNSPGPACLAPWAKRAWSPSRSTMGEPWQWNSALSSPV